MDKNKYLENYYKENNPLAARLTIDKKLIKCILICVITTLIYLFIIITYANGVINDLFIIESIALLEYIGDILGSFN